MSKEAMKLALEALNWSVGCMSFDDYDDMPEAMAELEKAHKAIKALEEALANADADAEIIKYHEEIIARLQKALAKQEHGEPVAHWSDCAVHSEPAYTAGECDCGGYSPDKELLDSARAFYNATVADSQVRISSSSQEKRDAAFNASERLRFALLAKLKATDEDLKVYQSIADNYFKDTTPQQRTWVELNWSDLPDEWVGKPAFMEGAKWAEGKLKEKNT